MLLKLQGFSDITQRSVDEREALGMMIIGREWGVYIYISRTSESDNKESESESETTGNLLSRMGHK